MRLRKQTLLLLTGTLMGIVVGVWSPTLILNMFVPSDGYTRLDGFAYGHEDVRQRLDLYVPDKHDSAAPVVVFFYGGRWRDGDRAMYRFVGQALAAKGFVVAIPDYRLVPATSYPTFLKDCAKAVAWVHANVATFHGDPTRLFLMGHSAGAYNALTLALDDRWLEEQGLSPRKALAGVVGLAGPYDFYPFDGKEMAETFAPAADPAQTQPVTFVEDNEPPVFLATGADDRTVAPRNTENLATALRRHGDRVVTQEYPGIGHARIIATLASPLSFLGDPVLDDIVRFLRDSHPA